MSHKVPAFGCDRPKIANGDGGKRRRFVAADHRRMQHVVLEELQSEQSETGEAAEHQQTFEQDPNGADQSRFRLDNSWNASDGGVPAKVQQFLTNQIAKRVFVSL